MDDRRFALAMALATVEQVVELLVEQVVTMARSRRGCLGVSALTLH